MNYRLRNNQNSQSAWKPVIATFSILLIAGFLYFFMPRLIHEGLYGIARPFWKAEEFIGQKFTDIVALIKEKDRLVAENVALERQLDETRTALLSLDTYKKENGDLKVLLGRTNTEKRILAVILAKPNRSLYDTLVLDVGERNGVRAGDTVAVGDFILGAIHEVYPDYSKATLFSSSGEIKNVRIGTGVHAEAIGRGGGNFLIKLPKETEVKIGDSVTVPDINPKLFGIVEDIEVTETSSFQFILFKLPVNINSLNWVEIIKQQ